MNDLVRSAFGDRVQIYENPSIRRSAKLVSEGKNAPGIVWLQRGWNTQDSSPFSVDRQTTRSLIIDKASKITHVPPVLNSREENMP